MKIKIKFDKTKIKIGHDGKIESYQNKDKPSEAAFCEIDSGLLWLACKIFPQNNQARTYENIKDIPGVLPANGHDIYNYVARYGMANFKIQAIMQLDGRLDPDKFLKAIRLSVDVEPVFGCRFIRNHPPYWKRLDDINNTIFCTFEENDNLDDAVQRFMESPLDMDNDPMVKLKVISSGLYDTLCVQINHTCCDGTGAKEYLKLLSDIYSCIDKGDYVPKPNSRTRQDQDRLFSELGITDPEAAWDPLLEVPKTMWTFPWQPAKVDITPIAHVVVCRLPNGHIDQMYQYGKARGARINDIIMTAFYRVMFEMSQPLYGIPMDISSTVDLRRYLPNQKTEAIRNFSGGFDTRMARLAEEPFEGTLSRVVAMMNEIKKRRPGLQSAVGLERVEKANFHETLAFYQNLSQCSSYVDKCAPVISNLGFIDKSLIKFGEIVVTDAYIVPPAVSAPGVLLCISSYNDILTLAISYYQGQVNGDHIVRLLELIKKELIENCR